MSKEKQIEEMAVIIAKQNCKPNGCENCDFAYEYDTKEESCEDYVSYRKMAEAFYNAGYRKQSEVAREVAYDFQNRLRHIFLDMCDYNDYGTLNLLQIDSAIEALYDTFIAELKKKYTEGEG